MGPGRPLAVARAADNDPTPVGMSNSLRSQSYVAIVGCPCVSSLYSTIATSVVILLPWLKARGLPPASAASLHASHCYHEETSASGPYFSTVSF